MIWTVIALAWLGLLIGFVAGCWWMSEGHRGPEPAPPAFPPTQMLVDVHLLDETYRRGWTDGSAHADEQWKGFIATWDDRDPKELEDLERQWRLP